MKEEDREAVKGTSAEDQALQDFLEMEKIAETTEKVIQDFQITEYKRRATATEEMLRRRETTKKRNMILKNPRIAVGELVQVSKQESAGQLLVNKLDSQGTLKKHNSSDTGHTVTESAASLTQNASTMFSSVMSFNEVDLASYKLKRLMAPNIVIGNLIQGINDGDNTYNFRVLDL